MGEDSCLADSSSLHCILRGRLVSVGKMVSGARSRLLLKRVFGYRAAICKCSANLVELPSPLKSGKRQLKKNQSQTGARD
jgi:hypothetical protein